MSLENLYEFIAGEFQNVERMLQYPAGIDMVPIRDKNRVKMLGYDVEIWDSFKDGIQLIEDTDYTLGLSDADISGIEGFPVWGGYQILNAAYQGVELFVTAKIIGGYTARPYRPTYNSIDSDTIFAPDSVDDSLLVNSESGPVSITLEDGTYVNQRATIICNGSNDVSIQGSGLTDVSYSNIAVSFVWVIGGWLQLGGAGSGGGVSQGNVGIGQAVWDPAGGAIPYDKLLADGSIYNAAEYPGLSARYGSSYGGDGITTFGVPNMQGITPGAFGTQDVNGNTKGDATPIGSIREDQFQGHIHPIQLRLLNAAGDGVTSSNSSENTLNVNDIKDPINDGTNGDPRTGEYTRATELVGRWLIQAFDTVQEIPADPGLIKDYNLVWEGTPSATVPNAWGGGLFFLAYNYDYQGSTIYGNAFMGVAIDGFDREIVIDVEQAGGDSDVRGRYDFSTNSFTIETFGSGYTNPQVHGIYKWGDVATGELNPPVDGWETVWNETPAVSVPNSWGAGTYDIRLEDFDAGRDLTVKITITTEDMSSGKTVCGASFGWSANSAVVQYNGATNVFEQASGGYGGTISRIRKFNSLVNVVHSYNPNPLAIAQKDWVELWKTPARSTVAAVSNAWGTGLFQVVTTDAASYEQIFWVRISDDETIVDSQGPDLGSGLYVGYSKASNEFQRTIAGYYIEKIYKWQDAQATDAPKQVLADGWERLVYDYTNIGPITNVWGDGVYQAVLRRTGDDVTVTSELRLNTESGIAFITNRGSDSGESHYAKLIYTPADGEFSPYFVGSTYYIAELWKFTGMLRISANYNTTSLSDGPNQVQAINTDAGDVAITMPASPNEGDLFEVWNTGTNGNHITGLPGSIALGDGKGIRFRYVGGFRYEDVIIDEYSVASGVTNATATQTVKKYAGGCMLVGVKITVATTGTHEATFPEPFTDIESYGGVPYNHLDSNARLITMLDISNSSCEFVISTVANAAITNQGSVRIEGRWKAGA